MNAVLYMILTMSLAGSLLIGILLLAEHFWGRRMRCGWQYYLWLIVIARLLIPGGLLTVQPQAIPAPVPAVTQAADAAATGADTEVPDENAVFPSAPEAPAAPVYSSWSQTVEGRSDQEWPVIALSIVTFAWIGGALLLFVQRLTAYRSYLRCLRAGLEPVDDARLLNLTAVLAEKLGIKQPVEVCINPLASSPMLIGWRRPVIVLPELPDTREAFECMVLHELVHWKRHDHLYKWAAQIAVCIHWFNPLVWIMNRRIARLCELSCDERVIRFLGEGEAASYGSTLLNSMAGARSCRAAAGTLELSENKRLLKERLERMTEHTKKKRGSAALLALLCACLLLCAACTRVYVPLPALRDLPEIPVSSGHSAVWAGEAADLDIYADNAWIDVQPTDTDVVWADFDQDYYSVDVSTADGRTAVSCIGPWNGRDYVDTDGWSKRIRLYVPEFGVESVSTELVNSIQTGCAAAARQNYSLDASFLETVLPANLQSSVISAQDSLVRLCSDDDFAATQVDLDLTETLLLTAEGLRSRVERGGSTAHLACSDPRSEVQVMADSGLVMLNAATGYSMRDLIARWASGMSGRSLPELAEALSELGSLAEAGPFAGSGAEQMPTMEPTASAAASTARPSEPADSAEPQRSGTVRGLLQSVGEGVGDLLSEVGDSVGSLLEEVGDEVRSGIRSAG